MQEVEITSARLAGVWWAFAWRFAAVWFALIGVCFLILCLIGFTLMRSAGLPEFTVARMLFRASAVAAIAGIPAAGLIAVRMAMQARTGKFRIGLLENSEDRSWEKLEPLLREGMIL